MFIKHIFFETSKLFYTNRDVYVVLCKTRKLRVSDDFSFGIEFLKLHYIQNIKSSRLSTFTLVHQSRLTRSDN